MVSEMHSVSAIVLDLRSAFRAADFDRAEEALLAREAALTRHVARLHQEDLSELRKQLDEARAENAELRKQLEDARASLRAAEDLLTAREAAATGGGKVVSKTKEPILLLDSDDEPALPSKKSSPIPLKIERSLPVIPSGNENTATSRAEPDSPIMLADASKSFWDTMGKIEFNSVSSSSSHCGSDSDSSA